MKIVEQIKAFWSKIVEWVKGVSSKADDFIVKYAPIGVSVINWIKELNESSTADSFENIMELVSKNYGKKYVEAVRKWLSESLPVAIDSLNLAKEVAEQDTLQGKVIAARQAIAMLPEEIRASIWTSMATMLANSIADDGKLSVSEAFAIIAYVYENKLSK